MLQYEDEVLFDVEYEYIATSDYDSIATILPELIQAYYKHQIYEHRSLDISEHEAAKRTADDIKQIINIIEENNTKEN